MNPQERKALEQEFIELHFGCHEAPDELKARLKNDAELAALFEEVKQTATLLGRAAKEPVESLALKVPDKTTPTNTAPWFGSFRRVALIAASILVLLNVTAFSGWIWNEKAYDLEEDKVLRLVLSGPPGVPDAATSRFNVETWTHHGTPKAATIRWRVENDEGKEIAQGEKESTGQISIDLSAKLVAARNIEVTAQNGDIVESTRMALQPGSGSPLVHLTLDKPAYRPGETLRIRGVFLNRISLRPDDRLFNFRIVNPKGSPMAAFHAAPDSGAAAAIWELPINAIGGNYALELRSLDNSFTLSRAPFLVRNFKPDKLTKKIDLDRSSYDKGSEGLAEVTITRLGGEVASDAEVAAEIVSDGQVRWSETKITDAQGRVVFQFKAPDDNRSGNASFVLRIVDGNLIESAIEVFDVPNDLKFPSFPSRGW